MYPMPPCTCRHQSPASRTSGPAVSLAMVTLRVTFSPAMYRAAMSRL
ncbi:Uncharacterised protein [Mycobacteroides abscessus subsp. abscessus]|nr:Uncharacterised protein [Mycobacteroides abscessus subsp. abscessus]SKW55004.1 Uncharacterised protein [Mycobacteroides abscessus subsp. abscessus]